MCVDAKFNAELSNCSDQSVYVVCDQFFILVVKSRISVLWCSKSKDIYHITYSWVCIVETSKPGVVPVWRTISIPNQISKPTVLWCIYTLSIIYLPSSPWQYFINLLKYKVMTRATAIVFFSLHKGLLTQPPFSRVIITFCSIHWKNP